MSKNEVVGYDGRFAGNPNYETIDIPMLRRHFEMGVLHDMHECPIAYALAAAGYIDPAVDYCSNSDTAHLPWEDRVPEYCEITYSQGLDYFDDARAEFAGTLGPALLAHAVDHEKPGGEPRDLTLRLYRRRDYDSASMED